MKNAFGINQMHFLYVKIILFYEAGSVTLVKISTST